MLIGEYTHTIDDKKRLSLPSKFRKEIGREIVITRGLDSCLFIYSKKEWSGVVVKLSELSMGTADSRGFNRFLLSGALETTIDSIGRILIPDYLKSFAKLKSKVVLTGVNNRIEIWDEKLWQTYRLEIEKQADMLAQKLGDIGAL